MQKKSKKQYSHQDIPLKRTLGLVFLSSAGIMTLYETLKQVAFPLLTLWESHLITIFFTAILATISAFFTLRSFQNLYKILSGMLSICCVCKKVRDKDNSWKPIDNYVSDHSEASFSHGYCPECYEKAKEEMKSRKGG